MYFIFGLEILSIDPRFDLGMYICSFTVRLSLYNMCIVHLLYSEVCIIMSLIDNNYVHCSFTVQWSYVPC